MPKPTKPTDFKGLTDWVEIFKTGQHPGKGDLAAHTFSQADLDQIVANHDASHPVPHVITHNELYSPFAYAQGVELKREGDSLYVRSDKVNPDFEQLVQAGSLYSRSVRILKTERGFELGHIAWLGAEPPAVQGLKPVEYASANDGTDFTALPVSPSSSSTTKPGENRMGDFTREEYEAAVAKAAADAKAAAEAEYAAQKTALEAQLLAERAQKAKGEWDNKIKALISAGQLTPAQAEGLVEFALALPEGSFEFSRADGGQKVSVASRQWLGDFLQALPKQVAMAADANPTATGDQSGDWTQDAEKVAAKAVEYQAAQRAKGLDVSTAAAVNHVLAEKQ